jgi:alanyl-tRNA synthetase
MTDDTIGGLASHTIVERYLEFFGARGHLRIAGGPLVSPEGGTSFTIAGMQPLMPYLRGLRPPPAPRLTGVQRCLRTVDVDAVGTNGRKMTLFHMLGNWSIGDYGRREAIALALGLLGELGVDRASLWVTTFGGDAALGQGPDEEAAEEWHRAGMAPERIVPLGAEDNWWGPPGASGPCGPDSEIFVDRGAALGCGAPDCRPGCACERFLEIWNLVFIEYEQDRDGVRTPLPLRSVDTGMGLERVAAVLQGVPSVFDIDLFGPARRRLEDLAPIGSAGGGAAETRARRLIVDHVRAALFAGLAGVAPDRDGRGSVVRRLIRRAARQGRLLGLERPFLGELVEPLMRPHLPLLEPGEAERLPRLAEALTEEERRFSRTLTASLRLLGRLEPDGDGVVPGERVFALHADCGFPADLAAEVLAERGLRVDWEGYERALAEHRAVSRVSKEQHFGA